MAGYGSEMKNSLVRWFYYRYYDLVAWRSKANEICTKYTAGLWVGCDRLICATRIPPSFKMRIFASSRLTADQSFLDQLPVCP
jgi:hypothetical protein